jgi:hypothetical protein
VVVHPSFIQAARLEQYSVGYMRQNITAVINSDAFANLAIKDQVPETFDVI